MTLQVVERRRHRRLVGGQHLGLHGRLAEGVKERDRLGRAEGEVVAGHTRPAGRSGRELFAARLTAREERAQVLGRHLALQAEGAGAGQPASGRLAGAQVVVLDAGRHRLEVVVLAAGGELADAEHPVDPRTAPIGSGRYGGFADCFGREGRLAPFV